jgi:hypothetical protein
MSQNNPFGLGGSTGWGENGEPPTSPPPTSSLPPLQPPPLAIQQAITDEERARAATLAKFPEYGDLQRFREQDWRTGLGRGEEIFGKEGDQKLGRIGSNLDIQRVLQARRAQAGGISPQEQNLMRAQMLGQISSANTGAMRQLRGVQGASGVQGGVAGAQAADILRGGQQAMLGAERDIQMQNLMQKRAGVNELEKSASDIGKYDLGQQNKELMGRVYSGIGEQMMGMQERTAIQAGEIARAQERSASSSGGKK